MPIMSPLARQARKDAQLARVAAKGSPNYAELYARQPVQLAKAAEHEARRKQITEAKAALEVLAMSEHTGATELFTSGAIATKSKK